ncbi:AAA family ATPase [Endozoicomonas sp. SCSIO W0465]|uniref:AAA family ATPase n=1 Tax=Endozoicomonas sp. SCSIO W0465 TaxID=2918516 RepID=UPI002074DB7B|nr:AAA family ATPase [Endozoicomonas sp. SCSIO W0465]USE36897.1 ATP-binding protein [Endozoicomonas sp. SCSIO W0465]
MIISLIGSHGTGKTMLCNALVKALGSEWSVFSDYYRKIAKLLHYKTPRDALLEDRTIRQVTSTAMAGSALGAMLEWIENLKGHGIIDTGPPSLLAYHRYWLRVTDTPISPYMLRLAKATSQKIDAYCYLPTGKIALENDGIRSDDVIFQKDIDQWVLCNRVDLGISAQKVLMMESTDIEKRTEECIQMIQSFIRK